MNPRRFARLKADLPKPPAGIPPARTLVQALHDGLRGKSELGEIEESEYDHEFTCRIGKFKYVVSASFDYVDEQWWGANFQQAPTFLPRLFGQYKEPEARELALAIDAILREQKWTQEVRWYKEIDSRLDQDFLSQPVT